MNRIMVSILLVSAIFSQQEPEVEPEKPSIAIDFVEADDELLLNWSVNTYVGYPVYTAEFFSIFDQLHPVYGLSLGTPFGLKTGLAYSTFDIELINYVFGNTDPEDGEPDNFYDTVFHVGLNSGLFINDLSLSLTAAVGKYDHGTGFVGGMNIDLPYWGDYEVRSTIRFSAVPMTLNGDEGRSGWVDIGVSLGYEF